MTKEPRTVHMCQWQLHLAVAHMSDRVGYFGSLILEACISSGLGSRGVPSEAGAAFEDKLTALRKAHHVVVMEAIQLRAYLPPLSTPEETAAIGPQLAAIMDLLQQHADKYVHSVV